MTIAKAAYDAYCEARGWKSVRGDPLPQFDEQSSELKMAWLRAAEASITAFHKGCIPVIPRYEKH